MFCEDARVLARIGTTLIAAALGASSLVTTGCNGEPDRTATACAPGGPGSTDPGPCDPDPLRTDLPPLWNDLSVDIDDCPILEFTPKYNEPDAMIFKAMIYVESRFQYDAVGCTGRGPCCPEVGWTGDECGCLGVMQNGPECGASSGLGLLSDSPSTVSNRADRHRGGEAAHGVNALKVVHLSAQKVVHPGRCC